MRYQRLFILLFIIVFAFNAKAAVFTVTSNADTGPGTLREALTLAAANGSAEQDFIYFNLPDISKAGRTITLTSILPEVTSNLVIDGSTQPGVKFGVSDAKISLLINIDYDAKVFRAVNQHNIELYGLMIHNPGIRRSISSIAFTSVKNVIIGAPGKGNVFKRDCFIGINSNYREDDPLREDNVSENVKISSNFMGVNEDGQTLPNDHQFSLDCSKVRDLVFGGTTKAEGNLISGGVTLYDFYDATTISTGSLLVMNNMLGVDYTGTKALKYFFNVLNIDARLRTSCIIKDNLTVFTPFRLSSNCFFEFKGNKIGTDITGTKVLGNSAEGLSVSHCPAGGIIGGLAAGDKNIIAGSFTEEGPQYFGSIRAFDSHKIELLGNIFKCNISQRPYEIQNFDVPNKIQVTGRTINAISGTCPPNARVDLYYTLECNLCEPQQLFATTTSDASGNWAYSGVLQNYPISASSTLNGSTSEFSQSSVDIQNLKVVNVCDGNPGSIYGVKGYGGNLQWLDINGNTVGTNPDLVGVPAGKYKLIAGFGCVAETAWIEVFDEKLTINTAKMVKANASCVDGKGSIKGITVQHAPNLTVSASWKDNGQREVSTTLDLLGALPGEYTLFVSTVPGCVKSYGPIVIDNGNSPVIIQTNMVANPSGCSRPTGAITGIRVTGTGVIRYSWKNADNVEVGTNARLENQPPGVYTLSVSDDSQCGTVATSPIEIPLANDITINANTKTVQDATCDNYDGSIKNLQITGSNLTYSWRNEQDVEVGTLPDLTGAIAGTYTLVVSGQNYCSSVASAPITIQSTNGVSLDYSKQGGISPSCNHSDGSITGLQAPGATTYNWVVTGTNTTVGQNLDLTGVPAGFYTLTISNGVCSRSYPFEVQGFPPTAFTGITYTKTKTCDAFPTGTITLNTDNANEEPRAYQWYDEQGNAVGYTKQVQFLKAGRYKLVLEDKNYCLFDYPETFMIEAYPELKVTRGTETHIQCGVGTGSVTATTVTGGTGTYTYQWKNADTGQDIPGKTQASINGLAAGNYILEIKDDGGCNNFPIPYTIVDQPATPPTPIADDIQVYGAGKATIKVKDAFPTAIYRIYESATSPLPIKDTIGGDISINVTESRSYYISLTYGYCESARAEVKVFLSALSGGIPNTFTPNGDGVNDLWNIPGLGSYPSATVSIFNRYGQNIYQSVGYAKPFDGTRNGKQLPVGVYYYIITLRKGEVLSGYVTIIR